MLARPAARTQILPVESYRLPRQMFGRINAVRRGLLNFLWLTEARVRGLELGADILRLWVASVDFREELRFGPEILARVVEAYRKLRNTLRILAANLYDFDPDADAVPLGERQSGLLLPEVRSTGATGLTLTEPLYLTLGRSADATVTPAYAFGRARSEVDAGNRSVTEWSPRSWQAFPFIRT